MNIYEYDNDKVEESIVKNDALEDLLDVEDLLAKIEEIDKNVDLFKKQKAKRTKILSEEIKKLEEKKNALKATILNTLEHHEEKSLTFPVVGTIRVKNGSSSWNVLSDDGLIDALVAEFGEDELIADGLLERKLTICKTPLKKKLEEWHKGNDWPNGVEDKVERKETKDSVTISFNKGVQVLPNNFNEEAEDSNGNVNPLDGIVGEVSMDDLG